MLFPQPDSPIIPNASFRPTLRDISLRATTESVRVLYSTLRLLISSTVFAASVTYLIPVVAILWGVWDGEKLNIYQFIGAIVVLFGVYLVNKKKSALTS